MGAHHNLWDPPLFHWLTAQQIASDSDPTQEPWTWCSRPMKQRQHGGSGHGGRLNLSQQPEAPEQIERRSGCSSWSGGAGSRDDDTVCSMENYASVNEHVQHVMPDIRHQLKHTDIPSTCPVTGSDTFSLPQCRACHLHYSLVIYFGSRALSFSDPYIHFACLSVRHSVCPQLRS